MAIKNITGVRFGRLVAERLSENPSGDRAARWVCRCDCGGSTEARGTALRYGKIKSCGCLRDNPVHLWSPVDLVGRRFGRLTVLEKGGKQGKSILWKCVCDCGKTTLLRTGMLSGGGGSQSCGCAKNGKRQAAPKEGIYCIVFRSGAAKFGRTRSMLQRLRSYRREFAIGGGGVAICIECDDSIAAENRLIHSIEKRYQRATQELFIGVHIDDAKSALKEAAQSANQILDATVVFTGPGPVAPWR